MKKKINYFILLLFTALVVYISLKDNFNIIIDQIFSINIWYLLLAILLIVLYWLGRAVVLQTNIKSFNHEFSLKKAFEITLKTQFFDGVTPFASGGQPFEIFMLKKEGIKLSEGTGIVISDSFVYQLGRTIVCFIAVVIALISKVIPYDNFAFTLAIISFLINALVCFAYFGLMFFKKFSRVVCKLIINIGCKLRMVKNKQETMAKTAEILTNYHETAKYVVENKDTFKKMLLVSILFFISHYSIPFVIFTGIGYTGINYSELFALIAFTQVVGSFIPVPGSTGGLEYFFVLFTSLLITNEVNGAMILWRFVTYYLGLLVGAILVNRKENE